MKFTLFETNFAFMYFVAHDDLIVQQMILVKDENFRPYLKQHGTLIFLDLHLCVIVLLF